MPEETGLRSDCKDGRIGPEESLGIGIETVSSTDSSVDGGLTGDTAGGAIEVGLICTSSLSKAAVAHVGCGVQNDRKIIEVAAHVIIL